MVGEIIMEAIAFVALLIVAIWFGKKSVRLIDRQHHDGEEFIIPMPRREEGCTELARELSNKFKKHNRTASVETETLICLPSVTTTGFFAFIEALVMTVIIALHHFKGISQFMIGQKIYDYDRLFEGDIGAIFVLIFILGAFGILLHGIIVNAAKARACKIGNDRANRRTVRFAQAYSIGEIAARFKWAVAEEIAECKARRAQKRRKKVAVRRQQPKSNIVQLPTAINN